MLLHPRRLAMPVARMMSTIVGLGSGHGTRRLIAGSASGLLFIGLLQLSTPAYAIGAPGALSPTGAVATNTPKLTWSRPAGAVRFDVRIDNDSDFSSPSIETSTTNTQLVPTKTLAGGQQYWQVCALATDNSRSCSDSSFTVSAVKAPQPVSPLTGSTPLVQPEDPPLLKWAAVEGAEQYVVQVDKEADGVDVKEYKTRTLSLVVPDPLEATSYFWRVKAIRGSGVESAFSLWQEFSLTPLPAVQGITPVDFAAVEDVELSWNPVKGAAWYELQVALDSDFASLVDPAPGGFTTTVKVLGTRYSPPKTYDNNQYYWRVRAIDTNGNASPWPDQAGSFIRVWPDTPQTVFPADADHDSATKAMQEFSSAPFFQWTPVQHATQYEIQVGSNANFSPGTYQTCQVAGTTYTPQMFEVNNDTGSATVGSNEDCWIQPDTEFFWRVRALDLPFTKSGAIVPGVQGIFSESEQFVWHPQQGATFSPSGGETVDIPTLTWDFPMEADKYRVEIKNAFNQPVGSPVTTRATSYTPVNVPALDPAKGPFTWSVTAYDAQGPTTAGEPGHRASLTYYNTFNVSGQVPTTGAAALTPLSGLESDAPTVRAPALRWEPLEGAKTYQLYVGPADSDEQPGPTFYGNSFDDAYGKPLPYPAVTDTGTRFLSEGRYDWWVEAFDANGLKIGTGPEETFRIAGLAPVSGQSVAVDGETLASGGGCAAVKPALCDRLPATPVFSWKPVDGAAHYMLYVGEGAFTNVVEPLTNVASVAGTMWTPTMSQLKSALKDNQANQAYHWFVRPCKSLKECGPNPISTPEVAVNQFRKVSPAVKLVTGLPAEQIANSDQATVSTADITLDWEDYLTTSLNTTWTVTGEHGPQAAQWYRVQVDNDQAFTSPLETILVDQSRFTSSTKLYPEGILWWRVQAIDADGNDLPWSAPRFVKKVTDPITPEWPADGAVVSGNTNFEWQATSSTARYELEVWRGQITENDTSRRLFKATTGYTDGVKQTAYTWDRPIPASSESYIWRVRRVDSNSQPNRGPWTVGGKFESRGALPTLVSPLANATVPSNGPLLTWDPVAGATSYVLEVRANGASYNWARVTTAATAWATDRVMSAGTWQWRVTAKDAGGADLGVTAWRAFTVPTSTTSTPDTRRPYVVSKAPVTYAKRRANFVAKFNEPVYNVSGRTMQLYMKGRTTPVSAKVYLSADRKTATLNPSRYLRVGKVYVLKLRSGIRDRAGNHLSAISWQAKVR